MERITRFVSRAAVPALFVLLLLAACGKPPAPQAADAAVSTPAAASPASSTPVQKAAPAAPSLPAEVIFENGEVQGQHDGTWSDLEIGTKLGKGDAVKVGAASECQVKFAGMAVVSIRENTQVSIDSLTLNQSTSQVKLGLKSGTVLSKVKKLAGGDTFAVRTETAVGGVRGTEFGVTVTPQGATLVSVKEGTVAVLPAAYDPDAVRSMSADAVPGLEQIAKEIESSAPAVHAGQELTVTPEQAAKAETSFQVVQAAAVQVVKEQEAQATSQSSGTAAPPGPTAAELEARTKAVQAATATLTTVVGAPKALTPAHGQALKRIDALPAPSAPASAAPPSQAPAVRPAAAPVRISVTATPADSEIELNGKIAGTGSYEAEVNPGDSVTLVIRHEGYATKTVAVTAKGPASYPVQLQPMPIEAAFPAGSAALVGSVQSAGGVLVSADRQGQLAAFDRQGRALWKLATQNTPNENSSVVVGSDNLYFTGSKEFLVVAARTGTVVTRVPLDSSTTHLFGQRVAVSPTLGVFPTSTSLTVFNPASGATIRQIPIPGGTLMSPTISDGRVLLVNQAGVFLAVDPESGEVLLQVPTGASQPVATSVLVSGARAYFADRKGTVVCVDMDARKVVWKVTLKGQGTGVFQDLEASASGIYAFAGNTIYALSTSDGSELFPPIGAASTPPLERGGRLYFGTQSGTLAAVDERTGKTLQSLDLKAVPATRPKAEGSRLLFGSTTGQVFVIYPDSIQ